MIMTPQEGEQLAASLITVRTVADVLSLPPNVDGVLADPLDDALFETLAAHRPAIRHLMTSGNNQGLTDGGVAHVVRFSALESLDIEWSRVTDACLMLIGAVETLRWVSLFGCQGVTPEGVANLRRTRPELELDATA